MNTISSMPTGLHLLYKTYERSLQAILNLQEQSDRDRALNILCWILYACRPLSIWELTEALAIQPDMQELPKDDLPTTVDESFINDTIVALCGSLITIQQSPVDDSGYSTVHLTHFSLKEFLLSSTL